jgi:hypothetical protein
MDLDNLDIFRKQISEAQASIQTLYAMRRKVDERIDDLRDLIRASANFLPDEERKAEMLCLEILKIPETIGEAVKIALFVTSMKKQRLTPVQIRDIAEQRGFKFGDYSNEMASVHAILKRMREAEPPEVDYDAETGTYSYTGIFPGDITDESFFRRIDQRVFPVILERSKLKDEPIVQGIVQSLLEEVMEKPKRKKK